MPNQAFKTSRIHARPGRTRRSTLRHEGLARKTSSPPLSQRRLARRRPAPDRRQTCELAPRIGPARAARLSRGGRRQERTHHGARRRDDPRAPHALRGRSIASCSWITSEAWLTASSPSRVRRCGSTARWSICSRKKATCAARNSSNSCGTSWPGASRSLLLCGYNAAHFTDAARSRRCTPSAPRTRACRRTRPTCWETGWLDVSPTSLARDVRLKPDPTCASDRTAGYSRRRSPTPT